MLAIFVVGSLATLGVFVLWDFIFPQPLEAVPNLLATDIFSVLPASTPEPPTMSQERTATPESAWPTLPPAWTSMPTSIPTSTLQPTEIAYSIELGDLCTNPDRYIGENIVIRGQVIQFDYYTDDQGPYTNVQIGDIYIPSSGCLGTSYIIPVVVFFDGRIQEVERGSVVFVQGLVERTETVVNNSGVEITAPLIIGDTISRDSSCNVSLIVHTNDPRMSISLDRNRIEPALFGARFDYVCPGPHTLAKAGMSYSYTASSGETVTYSGLMGEMSIDISKSATVWEVQYSSGSYGSSDSSGFLPPGGFCFNCP